VPAGGLEPRDDAPIPIAGTEKSGLTGNGEWAMAIAKIFPISHCPFPAIRFSASCQAAPRKKRL
jgi:hypothetical protein